MVGVLFPESKSWSILEFVSLTNNIYHPTHDESFGLKITQFRMFVWTIGSFSEKSI